jgi:hypothetical protein
MLKDQTPEDELRHLLAKALEENEKLRLKLEECKTSQICN